MFRYYLFVMFGGTGILALILAMCGDVSAGKAVLAAFSTSATAFGIDALVALAVRLAIPARKMDPFHPIWRVRRWERKCLVKLGIRRWKDKIPEAGGLLTGFSKKSVADRKNNAYILTFLKETCYAELLHLLSVPFGFLTLFLHFAWTSFDFIPYLGLPVACINAALQLPPVLVQRYVRPFLLSTYQWNEKHQKV